MGCLLRGGGAWSRVSLVWGGVSAPGGSASGGVSDQVHTPRDQVHPQIRHPPGPGAPQSRHPPGTSYTPRPGTPLGPGTPPRDQVPPPEIRPLLRTVRILLECILVCNFFVLNDFLLKTTISSNFLPAWSSSASAAK